VDGGHHRVLPSKRLLHLNNKINSILMQVRLNWTLVSLYSLDGSTQLTDRLAVSTGIQAYHIKVASVYKGSVVVLTHITSSTTNSSNSSASIKA